MQIYIEVLYYLIPPSPSEQHCEVIPATIFNIIM